MQNGTRKAVKASREQRRKQGPAFSLNDTFNRRQRGFRSQAEYESAVRWHSVINVNGQAVSYTLLKPYVPVEDIW